MPKKLEDKLKKGSQKIKAKGKHKSVKDRRKAYVFGTLAKLESEGKIS
jgi:hypothetical protein